MIYRVFTLHPDLFSSFKENGLIARGISKDIIKIDLVNWRDQFGIGNYKQVDDKPFGGGSGMVLMCEPIYQALLANDAVSSLFESGDEILYTKNKDLVELEEFLSTLPESDVAAQIGNYHRRILPNNALFEKKQKLNPGKKVTISLTPRGFPVNQKVCEYLATEFEEINILCGRYEGFDSRVSELVDMELSIGNFVTNGGEIPAMALIEAVSRLLPDFVTKNTSILHDSFSTGLNRYQEQAEFVVGKKNNKKNDIFNLDLNQDSKSRTLFDNNWWISKVLPFIEHPQYTRPTVWRDIQIPDVLLSGDHKKIQQWRLKWY